MAAPRLKDTADQQGTSADQLLWATAELLAERSDCDVPFSDIAKRSGLNSALIKYYFGNKEGLLLALLEQNAGHSIAALTHLVQMKMPADEKLRIHVSGLVNAYYKSPYLLRLIQHMLVHGQAASRDRVTEIFVEPIVEAYRSIVQQGVDEGIFRPVDPAFLYYSLVGACDHIFRATYSFGPVLHEARINEDIKQRYITHLTDLFLRGLTLENH